MPIKELHTIVRPAQATAEGPAPLLVLLHGLGSDENDLMAFAPMLDDRLIVAAIRAPFQTGWGGYTWFDVQFGSSGPLVDETQVEESRATLLAHLRSLITELNADPHRFTLGGFSQGAMMSLGVALAEPALPQRVLLMSGVLLPQFEREAEISKPELGSLPFLVTHGTNDPILPISEARRMRAFLEEADAPVEYHEFPMAHEVSRQCLVDIERWLTEGLN